MHQKNVTGPFFKSMHTLPGTGWTSYMLAVARMDHQQDKSKQEDTLAIIDSLTSFYSEYYDDDDVIDYVASPNILDITSMGMYNIKYTL